MEEWFERSLLFSIPYPHTTGVAFFTVVVMVSPMADWTLTWLNVCLGYKTHKKLWCCFGGAVNLILVVSAACGIYFLSQEYLFLFIPVPSHGLFFSP